MREITIHKYLLIPVIISVICLLLIFYKRQSIIEKTNSVFFVSLAIFFAFYLLIVGGALYFDITLQSNLNQYDLNNDGFFSNEEITEAQKLAMGRLINDTPRNFSFIVGLVYSLVLAVIFYIISTIIVKIKTRLIR